MNVKQKTYEIEYSDNFFEDIEAHKKSGNKSILKKIESLVDELREHPKAGTGNPERLKGKRKGQWSRHITITHRLIYKIKENIVTVHLLGAWGHYDDK